MRGSWTAYALALALVWGAAAGEAQALVSYRYEGNVLDTVGNANPPEGLTYDGTGRIRIELTFAEAFDPGGTHADVRSLLDSYTISDDVHTLTQDDSAIPRALSLGFDADGNVETWDVRVETPLPGDVGEQQIQIESLWGGAGDIDQAFLNECTRLDGSDCDLQADSALRRLDPGSWTLVPEPGTAALLGFGLVALARRRS